MKSNLFARNNSQSEGIRDMDSFVLKMKHEDDRNLRIAKVLYVFYFVGIFLYSALYLFNIGGGLTPLERVSGACYVAAFILFALLFRKSKQEFSSIDYAWPVVKMLQMAKNRYRFWRPEMWFVLAGLIFVDVGSSLSFCEHMEGDLSWGYRMLIAHAVLVPIWIAAFVVGVWKYRRRSRPIYLFAREALADIE